jgi:hypothetical protein
MFFDRLNRNHPRSTGTPLYGISLGTLERPLPVGKPIEFIVQTTSRIHSIDAEETVIHS